MTNAGKVGVVPKGEREDPSDCRDERRVKGIEDFPHQVMVQLTSIPEYGALTRNGDLPASSNHLRHQGLHKLIRHVV